MSCKLKVFTKSIDSAVEFLTGSLDQEKTGHEKTRKDLEHSKREFLTCLHTA